jgi:hypothetical protein
MRFAAPLAIAALAAALAAGCGGSSQEQSTNPTGAEPPASQPTAPAGATAQSCETEAVDAKALRATGISCGEARQLMFSWQRSAACATPSGASRSACSTGSYRCLATETARGVAVSCARPGRSIAFIAKRG